MPNPNFLYRNSRFFEALFEARFLFDLRRVLVLREPPSLLNVLKSEVDAFGFDLVLALGDRTVHVQMKTRSGRPPPNAYEISEELWRLPAACVVWMLYDAASLEPTSYYVFGQPMPDINAFNPSRRAGYRGVRMRDANYRELSIAALADLLFPAVGTQQALQGDVRASGKSTP